MLPPPAAHPGLLSHLSVGSQASFLSLLGGCLHAPYSQIYCRLTDVSSTRTWAPGGKGSFCIWGYLWYPALWDPQWAPSTERLNVLAASHMTKPRERFGRCSAVLAGKIKKKTNNSQTNKQKSLMAEVPTALDHLQPQGLHPRHRNNLSPSRLHRPT